MQLADAMPHRCSHLVNLDGLPSRRNWPDVADHDRARLLTREVQAWLEHRHGAGDQGAPAPARSTSSPSAAGSG